MDLDAKIWRVYPNGLIKNETHVLGPHIDDQGIKRAGYDGDVDAWFEHNKEWRGGCAQIIKLSNSEPFILYGGCVSNETLQQAISALSKAEAPN